VFQKQYRILTAQRPGHESLGVIGCRRHDHAQSGDVS
jgi:hypothetical protein